MPQNRTSERMAWYNMRDRCLNPNARKWQRYGGRGITIDPSWDSFDQFYADMGPKPSEHHTLDRIDNNGPYSKENCRWTDGRTQRMNRPEILPQALIDSIKIDLASGMLQRVIADKYGVSQPFVSRISTGQRRLLVNRYR